MINRDEISVAKSLARGDFDTISFILFFQSIKAESSMRLASLQLP